MKKLNKSLLYIASGALCLFLALPASAQRPAGGGGNSGGGNSGGGGSRPAPSGGGGGTVSVAPPRQSSPSGGGSPSPSYRPSAPSGGNSAGYSRPQGGGVYQPPQRSGGNGQVNAPRGNYGYAPRQGNVGYAPRQGSNFAPRVNYAPRNGVVASRPGNYGYAPRTGINSNRTGVVAYRTAPQIGYGHGGYWGNHGYYHYNHGYYGSYYLPRLGFTCAVLPYGYFPFYWGDYQYFYSDGLYYQYQDDQYTVVEPPIGAEITTLPEKAQSIIINGKQYYELNGVYYEPVTKDDGTVVYQIAGKDGELNTGTNVQDDQPQGPQMGDIVVQLPPDCRKLKVNGEILYVSPDGVYYQQLVDAAGNKTYKVVGLPSDEPDQN